MRTRNFKSVITATFSIFLIMLFCSVSFAAITGTDSKGSYSYGEDSKKEGSKSKSPAASHGTKGSITKKGEGSGSKTYTHKSSHHKNPKEYTHEKKEGSEHKSYVPSGHGYMHKSKEGSGHKKKYSHGHGHGHGHGSGHGKSYSAHKRSGHGSAHGSGKSPFEHVLCFTKKLGLTPEQVERIKAHEFEFKKMKIQTRAAHAIAHMEMDRLVHSGTVDEAGLRALADRISEIKSISIHAMIEAKIVILKILTAEQRHKVSKMHSNK